MVDEESRNVASELPGPAPVNRDRRRDPDVLEGEVPPRVVDELVREAPAAEPVSEAVPPSFAPPKANARSGLSAFAAGVLGGLIASAAAAAGGYYLFAPKTDLAQENASRLAALEAAAQRNGSALDAETQREGAAIAALEKRLGALEAANAGNAAVIGVARDDIPQLSARISKLESGAQPSNEARPDLSALTGRIDKVEAALSAPKSETRVAPERPSAGDNAAAIAIVAGELEEKLASGAPFEMELAALERLGVEPGRLAALKAVVSGAPTGGALATSFHMVAPKLIAAASHDEGGGIIDRFLSHIRGLVQVHVLKETAGDDPNALVSQIEAALRRGDAKGALAAFGKLAPAARQAAGEWAAQAGARQEADAALLSIRETAIGRLTGGGAKP